MGYIEVDTLGNITRYSDIELTDSITLNDDQLCLLIKEHTSDYKFLNNDIVYRPKTSPYQAWDGTTWVYSQALVDNAKMEVWDKIKAYRDQHKYKGIKVTVEGTEHWIHSDEASRIQHLGLLGAAILHVFRAFFNITQFEYFPTDLQWKTMVSDNMGNPIWLLMTWIVALQIFAADMRLEAACFAKAEYHRYHLMQSTDPYNYNYLEGWPAVFGS